MVTADRICEILSKPYISVSDAAALSGMQYYEIQKLCKEGTQFKVINRKGRKGYEIDTLSFIDFAKKHDFGKQIEFELVHQVNVAKQGAQINNDPVNHPSHYTQNKFESIDEMMIAFGPEAVYHFCICNAWKYKNRAPYKGNFEEDMKKADWYLTKAKEIKGGNLWQE